MIEEEKTLKEKKKIKNEEEIKGFEKYIKEILSDEREFLKSYMDECAKKIEEIILNQNQEIKNENELLKKIQKG